MPTPSEQPPRTRELAGWRAAAACSGLPPQIVFAQHASTAGPALRACARCPVVRECEEAVAPAESWFDGVSAGRLWRNGRPVALGRQRTRRRDRRQKGTKR
ncbi:WhiB family transcriptional regulator [Streptomyces sp. L-9-10]|uniref:WhiB family transcriptional regulator n=1 Tax=Streptomyces sp. L-9-10 TaxID=1478131 RepID=UPI00101E1E1F|nr:WhiB family transcriptional regulator [Streptomyces sp. L-9-10]